MNQKHLANFNKEKKVSKDRIKAFFEIFCLIKHTEARNVMWNVLTIPHKMKI